MAIYFSHTCVRAEIGDIVSCESSCDAKNGRHYRSGSIEWFNFHTRWLSDSRRGASVRRGCIEVGPSSWIELSWESVLLWFVNVYRSSGLELGLKALLPTGPSGATIDLCIYALLPPRLSNLPFIYFGFEPTYFRIVLTGSLSSNITFQLLNRSLSRIIRCAIFDNDDGRRLTLD